MFSGTLEITFEVHVLNMDASVVKDRLLAVIARGDLELEDTRLESAEVDTSTVRVQEV